MCVFFDYGPLQDPCVSQSSFAFCHIKMMIHIKADPQATAQKLNIRRRDIDVRQYLIGITTFEHFINIHICDGLHRNFYQMSIWYLFVPRKIFREVCAELKIWMSLSTFRFRGRVLRKLPVFLEKYLRNISRKYSCKSFNFISGPP